MGHMKRSRTCARRGCKQRFQPDKPQHVYCSPECRKRVQSEKRWTRRSAERDTPTARAYRDGCPSPWKVRHGTQAEAEEALEIGLAKGWDPEAGLNAYLCPSRKHWHVGRHADFREKHGTVEL